LFSTRLIRKFEIYNDHKELVGVVREKPKAFGSDWVLENVDRKVIAFMVGDRKKKDYEIQTPAGEFLARCFRDSSLDNYSYMVEKRISGGDVDLFLLLCYIVVLDLAESVWATREGFTVGEKEKAHLAKARLAENKVAETKASKSFPGYAFRNIVLGMVQAGLLFALGNFRSVFFYAFGIAILATAFIGATRVKTGQYNTFAILMGCFGVISLAFSTFTLQGALGPLTFESTILSVAILIVGFGILANAWLLLGLFGDFGKK
jgi:hypothetical protein